MTRRTLFAVAMAVAAFAGGAGGSSPSAQQAEERGSDLLIRVQGPLAIEAGDTVGSAWVFGNDARVTGTVRRRLFVVNGTARIEGAVRGVTIVNGHLELGPTARVAEDVLLYRSTLNRSTDALVGGAIHEELGPSFNASALWVLWVSVTLALMVAGLVAVRLGVPGLDGAARLPTRAPGGTLLTTVVMVVGLPMIATLAFISGLGFVLGIFVLVFLIPALSLIGYLVSALAMGRGLLRIPERPERSDYVSVATGVFVLQLLALMPVVGVLIVILAGQIGAGALIYQTWRQQRAMYRRPIAMAVPA